jgi:hypothetical protein
MSWIDFDREDHCPACGAYVNGTTNTQGIEPPSPGDRAVCAYCQSVNVYGEDGKQRLPTTGEAIEHASDPHIQEILWAMRMAGTPPSRRNR